MPLGLVGKQVAVGRMRTRMGQQQPAGKTQGAARPAAEEVPVAKRIQHSPAVSLTSNGGRQHMDKGGQQLQSRLAPDGPVLLQGRHVVSDGISQPWLACWYAPLPRLCL